MTPLKRRVAAGVAASLALAAAAACLDEDVTGVRTAEIQLIASSTTVAAGDTFEVTIEAQGTGIARVVLEWGDGQVDTTTFSGPLEAAGDREHVYAVAGTYVLVGTVAASAGIDADSVTVTVN